MHIGCHLSVSGGFLEMGKTALSIDADTFQFFTRNPRGGAAKDIDPADAAALYALLRDNHFAPLVAHAPYTMNPCGADPAVRDFALRAMKGDLERMESLPGNYYNFHPGCHVGQGAEEGMRLVAGFLREILPLAEHTVVLLETMSGKGSEIGCTFEQIAKMIEDAGASERLGVCLDTCHVYSAGYDIVNDLDGVLREFDRIIGLDRLKAVHLNDSMMPFGSHKDRHACIGQGSLGADALRRIVRHDALKDLPFVLETPNELPGYAEEIRFLRNS